jgi:hypothetical protein
MEADPAPYDGDEYQSKAIATLCKTLLSLGNVEYLLEELASLISLTYDLTTSYE